MKKIRFGIVGLGSRGRGMYRLAGLFEEVELTAACDIRPENWYEKQFGADCSMAEQFPQTAFYESYDKMLDEAGLDAVMVETGADIHAEFCAKALAKNIHVLSDIPVVANLKEADMLWKVAGQSKAFLSTGANPNEQKFAIMLQDFWKKGLLGKPYYMEGEYIHPNLPQNAETDSHLYENGNWRKLLAPIRYCTHSLGPLLTILEEDLRTVSCFGTGMRADDYMPGWHKDDMMCAQFQTASGVVVRLLRNGRCRAVIGEHNYRVFGTEGYMERIDWRTESDPPVIRWNSMKELDVSLKKVDGEFMPPAYAKNKKAAEGGHGGIDYALLDHFFQAVLKGGPAPIPLKDGLRMTLPGIYAEESAKRGGQVLRMTYPWDEDWSTEII